MNCPNGCKEREWDSIYKHYYNRPAQLHKQSFMNLSKSGKTLYEYFWCSKCKRVYRKGHRIFSMNIKQEKKEN